MAIIRKYPKALACFALLTLPACTGGSTPKTDPPPTKTIADTLAYTAPSGGTYSLVRNASSTSGHLMLDLVGPASTSMSGVGFYLSADTAKVSWGTVSSATFTNAILKSKITGDVLQAGVFQKGTTAPVTTTASTVLATIALDLKPNVPVNSAVSLSAPTGKAVILNPPTNPQVTAPITISVGNLVAN